MYIEYNIDFGAFKIAINELSAAIKSALATIPNRGVTVLSKRKPLQRPISNKHDQRTLTERSRCRRNEHGRKMRNEPSITKQLFDWKTFTRTHSAHASVDRLTRSVEVTSYFV